MDNVNLVHEEVIKMPYGKPRTGRTPVKKRKSAAKAPTGRSGLKGALSGGLSRAAKAAKAAKVGRSGVKGAKTLGSLMGISKAASRMGTSGMRAGAGGLKGKARKGKPTKRTMRPKPKPKPARKYQLRGEKATLKKRRGY